MENTLADVAQILMDLFYRELRKASDFFGMDHFKFLVASGFSGYLQDEYEKTYQLNLRETGVGYADISESWVVSKQITTFNQAGKIIAKAPSYMSFRYDSSGVGIHDLRSIDSTHDHLIRMKSTERWKLRNMGDMAAIIWFPSLDTIEFAGRQANADQKFNLLYVPDLSSLNDELPMPMSLNEVVVRNAFNLLIAAKNGTPIIDKTADNNPNVSLATEINAKAQQV